ADHWLRLAQLLVAQPGRESEAAQAARRALERSQAPALARAARGVFERCAAWSEAADLLRAELAESDAAATPEALRALARIEWDERGRAAEADRALAKLAARAELELADCERWAAVRAALGDRAGAIEQRRRALDLARDTAGAARWLALAGELLELGDA